METKICKEAQNIIAEYNRKQERVNSQINYFDMLRFNYRDEKHLHSAFIANLLDINGAHNMGDFFLKAFLRIVLEDDDYLNSDTVQVFTEYSVYEKGKDVGKVDILVVSEYKALIIENKVDAPDQKNQLLRYRNFGKAYYHLNGFELLYLTRDGAKASEKSKGEGDENPVKEGDYKCISYKKEILRWLNECIKLEIDNPIVRDMIEQYKGVINDMLGQSLEDKTLKSIKCYEVTENDLFNHYFFKNLSTRLESIDCELEVEKKKNYLDKDFSFYVSLKNAPSLKITFRFVLEKSHRSLCYGIEAENGQINKDDELVKSLRENYSIWDNKNIGWICSNHFDKYRNWGAKEYMMTTNPNSKLYDYIITLTKELLYAAGVKLK